MCSAGGGGFLRPVAEKAIPIAEEKGVVPKRRGPGAAATILTGPQGDTSPAPGQPKKLLGH